MREYGRHDVGNLGKNLADVEHARQCAHELFGDFEVGFPVTRDRVAHLVGIGVQRARQESRNLADDVGHPYIMVPIRPSSVRELRLKAHSVPVGSP